LDVEKQESGLNTKRTKRRKKKGEPSLTIDRILPASYQSLIAGRVTTSTSFFVRFVRIVFKLLLAAEGSPPRRLS
jgi:hypothetical protein